MTEEILRKAKQYRDELESRLQARGIVYQLEELRPQKFGMDKFLELIFEGSDENTNETD